MRNRSRNRLLRVLAAVFAAIWLLPGFGIPDLIAAWWIDWPRVLEAGWGAFAALIVASAFAATAVTGGIACARTQLLVALGALVVSAAVGLEPQLLVAAAVLGGQAAILALVAGRIGRGTGRASPALLLVGATGVVPWCVYALRMWRSNRAGVPVDVTNGIDHFALQGALALALAALPFFAAFEARMRPLVGTAGLAAAYLGAVSLAAPGAVGAFSRVWAAAAIAWGAVLLLVAIVEWARSERVPVPVPAAG
jgi:hypothetical protein